MNKSQFNSIIRYLSMAFGTLLVKHNFASTDLVARWVEDLIEFITIGGPIIWSMWAKSHAVQAQKAIDLVNAIEGTIGSASDGTVRLAPGASPKPPSTPNVALPLLMIGLFTASPFGLTGCQGTTALVVATQTLKAVGEGAEATVATSAKMYNSGQIAAAQALNIVNFYDQRFQPAFRAAAAGVDVGVAPAPANLVDLAGQLSALLASYHTP